MQFLCFYRIIKGDRGLAILFWLGPIQMFLLEIDSLMKAEKTLLLHCYKEFVNKALTIDYNINVNRILSGLGFYTKIGLKKMKCWNRSKINKWS